MPATVRPDREAIFEQMLSRDLEQYILLYLVHSQQYQQITGKIHGNKKGGGQPLIQPLEQAYQIQLDGYHGRPRACALAPWKAGESG